MEEPANGRDSLLAEYSACQQQVGTLDSGLWAGVALVLGGSLAAIALLTSKEAETLAFAIQVTVLASFGLLLIELWYWFWRRHDTSRRAVQIRMREIEWHLDMRRNIYLNILANWSSRQELADWKVLPSEEQDKLLKHYEPLRLPSPAAGLAFLLTSRAVQVGLVLLAVAKWVEYSTHG